MNFLFAESLIAIGAFMIGYIGAYSNAFTAPSRSKWEYFGIWLSGSILITVGFFLISNFALVV